MTEQERRIYDAAYKKRLRQLAREWGLCSTCTIREPRDGWVTCDHCIGKRIAARRR